MRSLPSAPGWFLLAGLVAVLVFAWLLGGNSVEPSTAMAGSSAILDRPCTFTTAGRDGFPAFVWRWDGETVQLVGCAQLHEYGIGKAVARWVVGENVE